MSISVKICGLNSAEAADAAVTAGAVYGGLVFHAASPRNVTLEQAMALAARMRGRLKLVTLVADASDEELARIKAMVGPDLFQLHGSETPARVADIRGHFGVAIIKALAIAETADLAAVPQYEAVSDMLLFDARAPKGAARAGGHGAAFDWKILSGRSFTKPWFLAGGLTPDNVARAIEASGARLADVSSGVETAPGVKSAARIAEFVAAANEKVRA